jgi:Asp-tRNA(Asn)/Glu-tRNA(Gln) amidotransferase A subunit family amidase
MRCAGVPVPRGLETVGPGPRCIGVISEALEDGAVHPACRAAVLDTETVLRDAGYDVREVSVGSLWDARTCGWDLCARHAWEGYRSVARQLGDLRASTWATLSAGARISDDHYAEVLDVIAECPQRAARAFRDESVDAWLLPLAPALPLDVPSAQAMESMFPTPGGDGSGDGLGYTPIASVCGLPALTLPVAEAERAPVSMQIIGPRHSEARLLDLARDIERARPAPAMTASARLDAWRTR